MVKYLVVIKWAVRKARLISTQFCGFSRGMKQNILLVWLKRAFLEVMILLYLHIKSHEQDNLWQLVWNSISYQWYKWKLSKLDRNHMGKLFLSFFFFLQFHQMPFYVSQCGHLLGSRLRMCIRGTSSNVQQKLQHRYSNDDQMQSQKVTRKPSNTSNPEIIT